MIRRGKVVVLRKLHLNRSHPCNRVIVSIEGRTRSWSVGTVSAIRWFLQLSRPNQILLWTKLANQSWAIRQVSSRRIAVARRLRKSMTSSPSKTNKHRHNEIMSSSQGPLRPQLAVEFSRKPPEAQAACSNNRAKPRARKTTREKLVKDPPAGWIVAVDSKERCQVMLLITALWNLKARLQPLQWAFKRQIYTITRRRWCQYPLFQTAEKSKEE